MSDTEYGPAGVGWSGTETNELGPQDQLSQNQLPLIQLPTPNKSTSHQVNSH